MPRELSDYLRVVVRQKWIILFIAIVVPTIAVFIAVRQQPLYSASSEVLLGRDNLTASVTGVSVDPTVVDLDRIVETQAGLARVPTIAKQVLRSLGLHDRTASEFLAQSAVSNAVNTDILTFTVTDPDVKLAPRLATAYARAYTVYRRQLDAGTVNRAIVRVNAKIVSLTARGATRSPLYSMLVRKQQQLRTYKELQTSTAVVVRTATSADLVQPRPTRSGVLGLVIGLVLGIGLAFLRDTLDTRVTNADAAAELLKVPLLARIVRPPPKLRRHDGLVMLEQPNAHAAEAFRLLRTNLELARLSGGIRKVMITSATAKEGKSTTVANLAVAMARTGLHVVLVDLDLRRPYLDRLFDLGQSAGVTGVVLDDVDPSVAAVRVAFEQTSARIDESVLGGATGSLEVIAAGALPANPGELLASPKLSTLLASLADWADIVLVDVPPFLDAGDALAVTQIVDGIVVVVRARHATRATLRELARLLERAPASNLGFVFTDAGHESGYGYAYSNGKSGARGFGDRIRNPAGRSRMGSRR